MNSEPDSQAPAPDATSRSLDQSLIKGIAWTAAVKWLSQILTWGSTLVVARLLAPEDYGIVHMAQVFTGLVLIFSEFGIGTAVVVHRDLSRPQLSQLNTVAFGLGVLCCLAGILGAEPMGAYFDNVRLPPVIVVLSVVFIIGSFRTIPQGLLVRDLRFKLVAVIEAIQAIVAALVTVALAALDFRYWSLVLGRVAASVCWSVLTLVYRRAGFARPQRAEVAPVVRMSSEILTSRIAHYVYSSADVLVIGKLIGVEAVGLYGMGLTLASVPVERVTVLVSRVTPAIFAKVQSQPAEMRRYLLSLTQGLALICFPLAWGLALLAHDFVYLVLGEKWEGAIAPLRLLAAYAAFRCVTPLLTQVLTATGHTRFTARIGILSALVLPVAFVFASRWGPAGVAGAWLVVHPLLLVPVLWQTFRVVDLRLSDYVRALWPALQSGVAMVVCVVLLGLEMPRDLHPGWRLAAAVAVGAASYTGVLALFHRERIRSAVQLLKKLRSGA